MTTERQAYEKGFTRCTSCGCSRRAGELDGGRCRDAGWCATAREAVDALAAMPVDEALALLVRAAVGGGR